jgi:4'-phosphopantetheinyl transferase
MNADGIDLWQFPLDGGPEAVNAALVFLSREERILFRQFGNAQLAASFAIRRAARRIILARYLGVGPSDVRTRDAPAGKPELTSPSAGLHFNASHSKNRGILAVTRRFAVGADVERLRSIDVKALGGRILSPSERLALDHARPEDRDAGMFRVWTAKEALVKGFGVGLDLRDLPLISVPFAPAPAVWTPARFSGRMKAHGQWYVYSLPPSDDYHVGLAAPAEAAVTIMDARDVLAETGIRALPTHDAACSIRSAHGRSFG